jgi:4-diphosphocytidyl-2-C-methyl-D-erythritol kinase
LRDRGNDLAAAAIALQPAIAQILAALAASPDCLLARMSGSGATCFGLYGQGDHAEAAAARMMAEHPDWWVAPAAILP